MRCIACGAILGLGGLPEPTILILDIVACHWSGKVSFGSQTTECIYTPFFCSGQLPSLSIRWRQQLLLGLVMPIFGCTITPQRNPTWNTCIGHRQCLELANKKLRSNLSDLISREGIRFCGIRPYFFMHKGFQSIYHAIEVTLKMEVHNAEKITDTEYKSLCL